MPGIFILMISSTLFPAALLSFTLLQHDFLQRQGMDGKKYAKLAYFPAISGNSGIQKRRALPEDLWQLNHILQENGVEIIVSNFMKLSKQNKIYSGNTLW